MKLTNRVAIVTGGSRGIGKASAMLFAREGARVLIGDIEQQDGQDTVSLIKQAGGEAHFCRTDVSNEAQVRDMVEEAVRLWGRVDILFNNAGVILVKFLEETTEAEWDHVLGVNLKAIFLAIKHTVGHMRRQGGGVILNTASISSFGGQLRTPAYASSKGAVVMLTKSLAVDYGIDNIRVNCICPGITDTPMIRSHLAASGDADRVLKDRLAHVPLGRILMPEDIARAALYLVSDDSRGVTGIAHVVDCGITSAFEYDSHAHPRTATQP
jgi:NAD(P)-dependent dehydrogenase (short-subunit alcohol dehydrogenase family)